jgi:peptidyl-dipeptidase Dcp
MRSSRLLLALAAVSVMTLSAQDKNPLLSEWKTPFGAPPFAQIKEDHFLPAFKTAIAQQKGEVEALLRSLEVPTFKNTLEALDDSGALLAKVAGVFFNLTEANTNDRIQAVAQEVAPLLAAHQDDIALNPQLFRRVKAVFDQREKLGLSAEQRIVLDKTYRDFVRGGALLNEAQKTRFRKINEDLSLLELKFGENVLKENNAFKLVVTRKEDLAGLPEGQVQAAAEEAGEKGKWVFTLRAPSIWPFLQYSENRELRRQLLAAYAARCDQGGATDNKAVLAQVASLRLEKAQLLGFKTWAAFVLDDRMAKTPEAAYGLLRRIWTPALAKAKVEAQELQALLGSTKLEAADWRFYSEKVKKAKFDLDENALRPYFELDKVRNGAFQVAGQLYGITFTERKDIPVYNPEVRTFEVREKDGKVVGLFYTDYFPRASKRGGAWCQNFRDSQVRDGIETLPLVVNVGNFSRPSGSTPALLTPEEVETLFHEFGHALHALFTRCRYKTAANNVPTDFVELPSQVMEHWAVEPAVLRTFARHYQTGEVIPDALIAKIQKADTFNQGFITTEFVAAALLDMDWHSLTDSKPQDTTAFEKASLARMGLIPEILPRYRSTYFNHIMGGYSAGYYSYLWSAVLDCDAFQAFKEKGNIFDPKTAAAFRREILSKGGNGDAAEMYRKFRGADPSVEPLLVKRGLK